MIPTRRDLHFTLQPSSVVNWHAQGACVTQFINAMSVSFPDGERYFIHTVRHYRELITDPELQQAVAAFIGQEAMHGREHEEYNRLLTESGLPADRLQAHAARFFEFIKANLPAPAQLSVTIAQEHFTAIIAHLVLTDGRMIEGADPRLTALWRWHALEETEHKAVAFDVYQQVMGKGVKAYALRAGSMVLTTAGFLAMVLYFQQQLLNADKSNRSERGLIKFFNFLFLSPALLPRLVLPWMSYFRPGFHPWDQNNRDLLAQMDALVEETRGYAPRIRHPDDDAVRDRSAVCRDVFAGALDAPPVERKAL